MLPEQIWDAPDLPEKGMYLGRPAGSAQPLVWAHAEYLKLLRSAADGKVFDRIEVVENRYGVEAEKRTFKNHLEIFNLSRRVSAVMAGYTLRIVDAVHFRVVYSFDDWRTIEIRDATSVGSAASFVDIATTADQVGNIVFTLVWPGQEQGDRWLGRNISIAIVQP